MEASTIKAVVIGGVTYGDSSRIVRVLTRDKGVIPLWVRTSKRNSKSFWHPLAALELAGFVRKKPEGLANFKEADRAIKSNLLLTDPTRSALSFFIAEILDKSISEEAPLPEVFELVWDIVTLLESAKSVENLHVYFLSKLVGTLGLMPEYSSSLSVRKSGSLNLDTGEWSDKEESLSKKSHYLKASLAYVMLEISGMEFDKMKISGLNSIERKELLLGMVMFIQLQHAGLREIKSYEILETIFSK